MTRQEVKIFEDRLENLIVVQRMALAIAKDAQEKYCDYTRAIFYRLRQTVDDQRHKLRRTQSQDGSDDTDTDEERKEKLKSKRKPNTTQL